MKRYNVCQVALATLLLAPVVPALAADDEPALRVRLEDPQQENKNRFSLSYGMSFNITARYRNVGNVAPISGADSRHGPATGGGIDRTYDDGYNRVDSSGNKDGLTWNWGYRNESQVVGDTVVMHSTSISPISSKTIDGDPQHGIELTYDRELGRSEQHNFRWGIEGGFAWTDIDIKDDRPLKGGTRTIADAFNLGGAPTIYNLIPPGRETPPPYTLTKGGPEFHPGTKAGPGPLIEDSPTRTVTANASGALVLGERRFEADLFAFRLGPYIDFPIDDKWTLSFSAGPALGIVDSEFRFRQVVRKGGVTTFQSASGSDTDVVYGGYVNALIRYAIDEHWGVFVGGQYTGLSGYETKTAGQKVEIEFSQTATALFGVSFSF